MTSPDTTPSHRARQGDRPPARARRVSQSHSRRGRFVGRRSVKRHQRGRHAGDPDDVGAPAILRDRRRPRSDRRVPRWILRSDAQQWSRLVEKIRCLLGARQFYASRAQRSSEADRRKRAHSARSRAISERARRKKISLVDPSTGNAPIINRFSTALTCIAAHTTLETSCLSRTLAAAVAAVALVVPARAARQRADDATLLRVFLNDGTSLVSYGEPARVGDRVIFSMPTDDDAESAAASRQPAGRSRRLGSHEPLRRRRARATHYVQTQAEDDYAALSNRGGARR